MNFPFLLDYHNGVTEGVISVKKNEGRKVDPTCIKASNPYHECGEHCFKRNGEANARGVNKESGVLFFIHMHSISYQIVHTFPVYILLLLLLHLHLSKRPRLLLLLLSQCVGEVSLLHCEQRKCK